MSCSRDPLFTPRPLGPLLDLGPDTGIGLRTALDEGAPPHDVAAILLDELASPPAVLVVEDLHWADEATLDVVRLIARRISRVPTLLLLSYRDEQVHRDHPLQLLLGELSPGSRLQPAGLSIAAVSRANASLQASHSPGRTMFCFRADPLRK